MPPLVGDVSVPYRFANGTNKRIVELDLHTSAGRARLHDLVSGADVFVENLLPATLERVGLPDEPSGPRSQPGIRCSIRGWDSSLALLPAERAVDATIQAWSGLMWISGDKETPGRVPVPIVDTMTATLAALNVVSYVAAQARGTATGGWTFLVSMLGAATFLQGPVLLAGAGHAVDGPLGTQNLFTCPNRSYPVSDGHIALSVVDDPSWKRLCAALQITLTVSQDERFATSIGRLKHRAEVDAIVAQSVLLLRKLDAVTVIGGAGIPCVPVRSYDEVLQDKEVLTWITGAGTAAELDLLCPVGLKRPAPTASDGEN
jgi:formyl-CoA transferase